MHGRQSRYQAGEKWSFQAIRVVSDTLAIQIHSGMKGGLQHVRLNRCLVCGTSSSENYMAHTLHDPACLLNEPVRRPELSMSKLRCVCTYLAKP